MIDSEERWALAVCGLRAELYQEDLMGCYWIEWVRCDFWLSLHCKDGDEKWMRFWIGLGDKGMAYGIELELKCICYLDALELPAFSTLQ